MRLKPVVPRTVAARDAEDAVRYLRAEAGERVALDFVDSLESVFEQLSRHPLSGSLRYAYELNLPELRVLPLRRYSYLVFYLDRADYVDVWRVLHARRDIPSWISEADS